MQTISMEAKRREKRTKGEVKQLRRKGVVPGAVFGRGVEPYLVEVSARELVQVLASESGVNSMIDLKVDGKKSSVMISELDRDPVTRGFLHVGFKQINRAEKIHAHVPLHLVGEPEPVRTKDAILDQSLESLDVRALPGDLPPHIDLDVSGLVIGSVIRVADLPASDKIEVLTPEDTAIAAVHVARAAHEEVVEALGEQAPAEEAAAEAGEK